MIKKLLICLVATGSMALLSCASGPDTQDDDQMIGEDGDGASENASQSQASDEDALLSEDGLESSVGEQPKSEDNFDDFDSAETKSMPESQPEAEEPPTPVSPPAQAAEPVAVAPIETETIGGTNVEIRNIGYRGNSNGGTVLIETSAPAQYSKRYNADTNQFVIEMAGAHLPASLKRPYLMKDFSGTFGAINAYQNDGSTTARIVVQLKGSSAVEPVIQQEGNQLLIIPSTSGGGSAEVASSENGAASIASESDGEDVRPQRKRALGANTLDEFLTGEQKFYGSEISVQTKDADVRDVLNFIADQSGVNMIISDDVNGKISIKLRKIPWDQALVTVLRAKKLGYVRQGSVLRISSLTELRNETETARQVVEAQKALEPLKIKVIPLNYGDPADLVNNLTKFVSKGRGNVAIDKQTNSLVITDTEEVLERLSALVKELDIQIPQVMIEGKIVEATTQFTQSIGINWGLTGAQTQLSPSGGSNGGPINLTPTLNVQPFDLQTTQAQVLSLGLQVGTLDVLGSLSARIALAENESIAKVLSSPRIVTMNRQLASIQQKSEDLTLTTAVNGNTTTTTVNRTPYILELKVTPQITADGSVVMDMSVQREFLGPAVIAANGAHAVFSRDAKTKVLVRSGQTAVIGGIYQNDNTQIDNGVPVLKDVPVIGWLFKSRTTDTKKNELLIFLTPRILNNLKDLEAPDTRQSSAS